MKSDHQIRQDVLDELGFDPSVSDQNLAVSVNEGVVTLSGFVPSYADKYAAERAAFRVGGVQAIADEIDVKLPKGDVRSDEEIAKAALVAIAEHVRIPSTVKVTVDSGTVILRGEVQWGYQRDDAWAAVWALKGLRGVKNRIKVVSAVRPEDIKSNIEKALRRSADADAKRIFVSVKDGAVVLTGQARSRAEVEDAKWAAWAARGVHTVHSDIVVE